MHTVVETKAFIAAAADAGMNEEEREAVVTLVAADPAHGSVPSGWGGARKFRLAKPGTGKSGGYRIVTAYCGTGTPAFLITLFGKGEKDNLSKAEGAAVGRTVKHLCATYRTKGDR